MQWSATRCIDLSGSPFEQGRQHGSAAKAEIRENLAMVSSVRAEYFSGPEAEAYESLLRDNVEFLKRSHPGVYEEIEGIATGADVTPDEALGLNLPIYFLARSTALGASHGGPALDCSQILLRSEATADGSTWLGKTRDSPRVDGRRYHQVAVRRDLGDGRWLQESHVSGSITWPALSSNSDGLAIATSGIWSDRISIDWSRVGEAWTLVNTAELVRDCESVGQVRDALAAHPRLTPVNLTVVDREEAAVFEVTAEDFVEEPVSTAYSVRTNHFCCSSLVPVAPTKEENSSTHSRHERAVRCIEERLGELTGADLIDLLADHEGYPQDSLCRHADSDGSDTLSATVVRVDDGAMVAILGNPCEVAGEVRGRIDAGGLSAASLHVYPSGDDVASGDR